MLERGVAGGSPRPEASNVHLAGSSPVARAPRDVPPSAAPWQDATAMQPPFSGLDSSAQAALQVIYEGTASETGERFFMALVENLARALGTRGAWVTEYLPDAATTPGARLLAGGRVGRGLRAADRRNALPGRGREPPAGALPGPHRRALPGRGRPPAGGGGQLHGRPAHRPRRNHPRPPGRAGRQADAGGPDPASRCSRSSPAAPRPSSGGCGPSARCASARRSWPGWSSSAMDAIVQLDGELGVTGMNPAAERTFELPAGRRPGTAARRGWSAPTTRPSSRTLAASSSTARRRNAAPGSPGG